MTTKKATQSTPGEKLPPIVPPYPVEVGMNASPRDQRPSVEVSPSMAFVIENGVRNLHSRYQQVQVDRDHAERDASYVAADRDRLLRFIANLATGKWDFEAVRQGAIDMCAEARMEPSLWRSPETDW